MTTETPIPEPEWLSGLRMAMSTEMRHRLGNGHPARYYKEEASGFVGIAASYLHPLHAELAEAKQERGAALGRLAAQGSSHAEMRQQVRARDARIAEQDAKVRGLFDKVDSVEECYQASISEAWALEEKVKALTADLVRARAEGEAAMDTASGLLQRVLQLRKQGEELREERDDLARKLRAYKVIPISDALKRVLDYIDSTEADERDPDDENPAKRFNPFAEEHQFPAPPIKRETVEEAALNDCQGDCGPGDHCGEHEDQALEYMGDPAAKRRAGHLPASTTADAYLGTAAPEMQEVPWTLRQEGDTITGTWSYYPPLPEGPGVPIAGEGAGWLIELTVTRPVASLPTLPGSVGTATVRGRTGVRVMLGGPEDPALPWLSATRVIGSRWHAVKDITDYVPLLDGQEG